MYATSTLPPASSFVSTSQPRRQSGDVSRPQPSFHQNRNTPGNICDCGHNACYHLHQPSSPERRQSQEPLSSVAEKSLLERMKRLEETIQQERDIREIAMQRERQIWEREVRILREALAPFYKSEQDMKKKLIELEDKLEGNYDEQIRIRDVIAALDDANITLEKRMEEVESTGSKRKRVSRLPLYEDSLLNGHIPTHRQRHSSHMEERSAPPSSSSREISPNSSSQPVQEPEEARSSGILNLLDVPRPIPFSAAQQAPTTQEEPRSSGFLAIDLAERYNARKTKNQRYSTTSPGSISGSAHHDMSPPHYARSNTDASSDRRSPMHISRMSSGTGRDSMRTSPGSRSPQKRKMQGDAGALDLLADVSVASPMAH